MFETLKTDQVATIETFNIAIERVVGVESTPDTIKINLSLMRSKL